MEEYEEERDMCQALEDIYAEGVEMGEKKVNKLIIKLDIFGFREYYINEHMNSCSYIKT